MPNKTPHAAAATRFARAALFAAVVCLSVAPAGAADRVTLALNWKAQPELGGFYQAAVDGTYRDAGLEVTIKPGGPKVRNRPLLAAGRVDFLIGTNLLQPFNAVKQEVPTRAVAAIFQKDPQCLIAHPGQGYNRWDDLRRAPLLMANSGRYSFFLWMQAAHGFERRNLRPYNHSLGPFLANKTWIQQGYATAEPRRVAEALGRAPRVFLLADHGWNSYSTLIETTDAMIREKPGLVQRFVDASLTGWRNYLDGGAQATRAANQRIKRDNPTMTDGQIAYSLEAMRERGLVDSGDALTRGVGAMDAERVESFFAKMVTAGIYKPGEIDPARSFTAQFVNRGVGRRQQPGEPNAVQAPPVQADQNQPTAR
ncbi:MAG: ABC transporter substrate-binding protein [Planctomycetota bacterium]